MLQIITDSACDLPKHKIEELNIDVIPFVVHLDDKEYIDGKTIEPTAIYQAIRDGKQPTTSQIPGKFFWDTFTKYAEQGTQCVYIAFSSHLSGTCNTARLVAADVKKRYPDFEITICDSLSGSLAQGLIVLEAAKMAFAGIDSKQILARIADRSQNNFEHIFTVDDLNYLHRGGRINYASAFMGNILNIKPILHVIDGKMVPIQKARGKTAAIKRVVDIIKERSLAHKDQLIGITHADDPEAANELQELIKSTLNYNNFLVNVVGSVLGCHIGLGGVAAFFVNKQIDAPNLP